MSTKGFSISTLYKPKSSLRIFLFCLLFFYFNVVHAQCLTTAAHSPSVITNDNSAGIMGFSGLTNITAADGQYASAQATAILLSGSTNYLKLTGFGFSLPPYATICGIEVRVNQRATGINIFTSVKDNTVRLIKSGVIQGSNAARTTDWSTTANYTTYGSSNANWGLSLTAADVNSPDFGIAISVNISGILSLLPSAQIDHVEILVSYNTVLPITITSFQTTLTKNEARNTWRITEQEPGASVILQRGTGNGAWQNVFTLSDFSPSSDQYLYTDKLLNNGTFQYRLMATSASGRVHYSPVNMVKYNSDGIHLFPSVATTIVTIQSANRNDLPKVYDANGALLNLPATIAAGSTTLNITSLNSGHYFVTTSNGVGRFIKQ